MLRFLFNIFFINFQIILGLEFGFIFEVKGLQEDLLASLMVGQIFGSLLFICLDFLMRGLFWISWGLLDIPLSCLCTPLGTMAYCGLGLVLLDMVVKVLIKCVMGLSWYPFVSKISEFHHGGFGIVVFWIVWVFYYSVFHFSGELLLL